VRPLRMRSRLAVTFRHYDRSPADAVIYSVKHSYDEIVKGEVTYVAGGAAQNAARAAAVRPSHLGMDGELMR
jgi:hypothetical protein